MDELFCIINGCEETADGLVMVNDDKSGLTIFMIPACAPHTIVIRDAPFNIQLTMNAPAVVKTGVGERSPDLTMSFTPVDFNLGLV